MKKDFTDMTFIIDRSASMATTANDVIGGYNQLIDQQKAAPGEATVSLIQFDDQYEVNYVEIAVNNVPRLNTTTYVPRGTTALYDAIGKTITALGQRLANLDEYQRPEKVVVTILTDGHENASREYTSEKIKEMLEHQRDVYKWEIIFIGANQDAVLTAKGLGISGSNSMTYAGNSLGTTAAFASVGANMTAYRSNTKGTMAFEDKDREAQTKAATT